MCGPSTRKRCADSQPHRQIRPICTFRYIRLYITETYSGHLRPAGARTPMHAQRLHDGRAPGTDSAAQSASDQTAGSALKRVRLADLDSYIHISVIGTCLLQADLYDIVGRYAEFDLAEASEFEVHHAAVQIAAEGGRGADALHEVLDIRYGREIRRFAAARDEAELCRLWRVEQRGAAAAGGYWALLTHPCATRELRQRIVGELHGLSYVRTGPPPALGAG